MTRFCTANYGWRGDEPLAEPILAPACVSLMQRQLCRAEQFAFTSNWNGDAIIFPFATPEHPFRVSPMMFTLILCFQPKRATSVEEAIETFFRSSAASKTPQSLKALRSAIRKLIKIGVLVSPTTSTSRYGPRMSRYYGRSRPVPPEICSTIVSSGNIHDTTRILDVATGTGSLALQLAVISSEVTGIDVSKSFLDQARAMATRQNLKVNFVEGCANKLIFERNQYDVLTVSQAFHWLNPYLATLGFYRALRPGGVLFTLDSDGVLPKNHPFMGLGYGSHDNRSIMEEFSQKTKNYSDLFGLLNGSHPALLVTEKWVFRQYRPFDMDFARAFFCPLRESMPQEQRPWKKLREALNRATRDDLCGYMYWLLLKFTFASRHDTPEHARVNRRRIIDIRYSPCADGHRCTSAMYA